MGNIPPGARHSLCAAYSPPCLMMEVEIRREVLGMRKGESTSGSGRAEDVASGRAPEMVVQSGGTFLVDGLSLASPFPLPPRKQKQKKGGNPFLSFFQQYLHGGMEWRPLLPGVRGLGILQAAHMGRFFSFFPQSSPPLETTLCGGKSRKGLCSPHTHTHGPTHIHTLKATPIPEVMTSLPLPPPRMRFLCPSMQDWACGP